METLHFEEAIERLPKRARYVLMRRYGLGDRGHATLAELAAELGLSRERIRQLQRQAENTLKTDRRVVGSSGEHDPKGHGTHDPTLFRATNRPVG